MFKLVIFDMDGLLIDSEDKMWVPNEIKAMRTLGYEVDKEFLRTLMGGAKQTNLKKYHERFGNNFPIDEFYKMVYELNEISVANNEVPLKKGAIEIIKYLKENKINFCIGSSSQKKYVDEVLKSCKVFEEFENIVTGSDVKMPKPEPDIYLKCMELYGVLPEETLVLEDAHNGGLAAYNAGCRFILVRDLAELEAWDYEHALFVKNDLLEVIEEIRKENETTSSI